MAKAIANSVGVESLARRGRGADLHWLEHPRLSPGTPLPARPAGDTETLQEGTRVADQMVWTQGGNLDI